MLDNHYYYFDIPVDEKNKIVLPECCDKPGPDDPGCSDCCYDEWKKELRLVNQRYNREKEAAELLQKQIDFITDRKSRYKKWYDEIEYAEELSGTLCGQLEVILSQTQKIWLNTCNANRAIKKLFCMIRDFFLEADYLKCRYDELWNCIIGSSDPSLQEDKGIRTSLKSYGEKLEAVLKARDELLKLMVDAIRLSQLLRNNINTFCCPDKDTDCKDLQVPAATLCENISAKPEKYAYGFKSIICRWYQVLGCNIECVKPETPAAQTNADTYATTSRASQAAKVEDTTTAAQPTYKRCELRPTFGLPFCNDKYKYKEKVKEWLDSDVKFLQDASKDINRLNKNKEGLLACKASLTKALEEADPKLRCK